MGTFFYTIGIVYFIDILLTLTTKNTTTLRLTKNTELIDVYEDASKIIKHNVFKFGLKFILRVTFLAWTIYGITNNSPYKQLYLLNLLIITTEAITLMFLGGLIGYRSAQRIYTCKTTKTKIFNLPISSTMLILKLLTVGFILINHYFINK